MNYNCRALIKSVPFFRNSDSRIISDVVNRLKFEPFLPGDVIIMEGTMGDKMYFIEEGIVEIMVKNQVIATLNEGSYFGGNI